MSCDDKNISIEDIVSDINKDIKLDELSANQLEELLKTNQDIADLIKSQMACELPADSVFSKAQLDELGCEVKPDNQLPNISTQLDIDAASPDQDQTESCQKYVYEANVILDKERKEYQDLKILLDKLVEFQDHYVIIKEYFSEKAAETNRLTNKFQPILEDIRRLEQEISSLEKLKQNYLNKAALILNALASYAGYSDLYQSYLNQANAIGSKIDSNNKQIDQKRDLLRTRNSSETFASDTNIQTLSSYYLNDYEIDPSYDITNILDNNDFSTIKSSVSGYSSSIKLDRNIGTTLASYANNRNIFFVIDFIGLNYIKSQEDVYNSETGERSSREINFPIKENSLLESNNYFNNISNVEVKNKIFTQNPTGVLYNELYNKLEDPITNLFSLSERGLTDSETLVDPNLSETGLTKKREGSEEYFIQDQAKMESFYENLENNIETKKQEIREKKIKPALDVVIFNVKKLARLETQLLLLIGGINQVIINESSKLSIIIDTVEKQQIDALQRSTALESEITRITARLEEIKPTPEKVKQLLNSLSSKCFSNEEQPESNAELEKKVKDAKGNDPFGAKSLEETDPTLPTILDFKYWLEFSKTLNKVSLLPFPKDPTSLRYWPIGFFFVTPVKIVKIPLPIIWIPLTVIPGPAGINVIFLTINGLFISPVIFRINSNGSKLHSITVKGPSPRFGYDEDPVKSTIKIPLNIAAAKDALISSNSNLTDAQRQEYEIESNAIKEKLSRLSPETSRYKRLKQKLDDLDESVSGKTQNQLAQEALDKKESALNAIEKAKSAIKDRFNQLGDVRLNNCESIQEKLDLEKQQIRKEIDETYKLNIDPKTKRKRLKDLRSKLKKESISIADKKLAIKNDILSYFENIKLPSIKIPNDSTKLNPAPNPLADLKDTAKEQLSNFKNDPTAKKNKNVKDSLKRELNSVLDLININDIPVNSKGKVDIVSNQKQIKDKFKELTNGLIDKLSGKTTLNKTKVENEISDLEKQIEIEQDPVKRKGLKDKLNLNNSKLSNHNEALQNAKDNAMTSEKLKEVSSKKFTFNAFKSLSDLLPIDINFDPPEGTLAPIKAAGIALNGYIDSLNTDSIKSLFGGRTEVTPNTIKDVFFNVINTQIPADLDIPTKIDASEILSSSSGVLSSLAIPSKPSDLLKPFTLSKKIDIDLNILSGPLKNILLNEIDDLIECLPIDIENNFSSLSPEDVSSELQIKLLNSLDKISNILEPAYKLINLLKSTKGISLTSAEIKSFLSLPFGPIDFAKFTASALLKINSPNSASVGTFDLGSLESAKKLIQPVVSPIMNNPVSFIIAASAASIGLADIQRKLHPVMNADDLPPWERLSSKNFLFVLFLDEFISAAADKVGFFRRFI